MGNQCRHSLGHFVPLVEYQQRIVFQINKNKLRQPLSLQLNAINLLFQSEEQNIVL